MKANILAFALGMAAIALQEGTAHAALTPVNPQGNGNGAERCLQGSFCSGGSYDGAHSLIHIFEKDLGYARGSFTRVDDDFDRLWRNTVDNGGQVLALARYAGDSSRLGYDTGAGYHELTTTLPNQKIHVIHSAAFFGDTHSGDFVTVPSAAWIDIPLLAGVSLAFALNDLGVGHKLSSFSGLASPTNYANTGSPVDFMVAFRVPDTVPHYFIAWEDRLNGDFDYNDFVAEVVFAQPVPEPSGTALLMLGLAMAGLAARRRRPGCMSAR